MSQVSDVTALITAIGGLIAGLAALLTALTPLFDEHRKRRATQPAQRAADSLLSRLADRFADERDKLSRRTTISQVCALVACAVTIGLVLLLRTEGNNQRTLALALLTVVGVLTLIGGGFGLEKACTGWSHNRELAITAAGGTVIGLTAWITALFVTATLR